MPRNGASRDRGSRPAGMAALVAFTALASVVLAACSEKVRATVTPAVTPPPAASATPQVEPSPERHRAGKEAPAGAPADRVHAALRVRQLRAGLGIRPLPRPRRRRTCRRHQAETEAGDETRTRDIQLGRTAPPGRLAPIACSCVRYQHVAAGRSTGIGDKVRDKPLAQGRQQIGSRRPAGRAVV